MIFRTLSSPQKVSSCPAAVNHLSHCPRNFYLIWRLSLWISFAYSRTSYKGNHTVCGLPRLASCTQRDSEIQPYFACISNLFCFIAEWYSMMKISQFVDWLTLMDFYVVLRFWLFRIMLLWTYMCKVIWEHTRAFISFG